jgi:hypothetical protein
MMVRPTCEIVMTENPQRLRKEIVPESGLARIRSLSPGETA